MSKYNMETTTLRVYSLDCPTTCYFISVFDNLFTKKRVSINFPNNANSSVKLLILL